MRIKQILSMLLMVLMLLGCMMIPTAAEDDGYYHGAVTQKTVWSPSSDNGKYTLHRIPGMVVTRKGTVIIYCEARDTRVVGTQGEGGDWCLMDLYIQRSEDRGESFSEPIYICRGSKDTYATINNPVIMVGLDNTLHMLFCKDYSLDGGGLWYTRSTDDGKSWSEPRQLTDYTSTIEHDCFAFGPTHGICTSDGILMSPVWYVPKGAGATKTAHGPAKSTVMYSEDNGETWKLADSVDQILYKGAEYAIAELSDGSIMMNGRNSPNRYIAVAREPLGRWTYTANDPTLIDPGCCGGLSAAQVEGLPRALVYAGCGSTSYRTNVTVYCSFDDGWTWQGNTISLSETTKDNTSGGYVDVYVDEADGLIYVLYEKDWGKTVHLAKISLYDEFCNGAASPNTRNEIEFKDKYTLDAINAEKTRNIEYSFTGSSLKFVTEKSSASKKTQLDMGYISYFVDLETHKYMMARIRVNEESEADAKLSAYFIGGREQSAAEDLKVEQVIPKDGQWHDVIFDMSKMDLKGVLHAVELRLAGDGAAKTASVSMEIEALAFTKTLEEAQNYEFGKTVEPEPDDGKQDTTADAQATEPQDGASDEEEEKKGCGSTITVGTAILGFFGTGAALISRKKRKH